MTTLNFDPADFPRLREFARGYLHQDLLREYGSAQAAAKAYLADLSEQERKQVAAEARRFAVLAQGWSLDETNEALGKFGAAWQFRKQRELASALEEIRESGSG